MATSKEVKDRIAETEREMDALRAQMRPLTEKLNGLGAVRRQLKKEYWQLNKDNLSVLLKEGEAFEEMGGLVASRFGVLHAALAPVRPNGMFSDTREQAFELHMESRTDLDAVASFIRELLPLASPTADKERRQRWSFDVMTSDCHADGIPRIVTYDREEFSLVFLRHSRELPLAGPYSLEEALEKARDVYALDKPEEDEECRFAP